MLSTLHVFWQSNEAKHFSSLKREVEDNLDSNCFDFVVDDEEDDALFEKDDNEELDAFVECVFGWKVVSADLALNGLGDRVTGGEWIPKWLPFSYTGSFFRLIVVDVVLLVGSWVDWVMSRFEQVP